MEKRKKKNSRVVAMQRLRWGRIAVQIVFLYFTPALFSQAFGGVKEAFTALGSGNVLGLSSFAKWFILLCVLTVLFGRIFCGWACAFGALGDWIYQMSSFVQKKTGKKLPVIPEKILYVMQKIKYVVLAVILFICFFGQSALITQYSPWTVFSLVTAKHFAFAGYVVAAVLLILIMIGMAIQERFFCQCLCPLGAIFSILPEIPFFALKRDSKKCLPNCQACRKQCPVHIKVGEDSIKEGECIRCGRCMQICPRKNIKPGATHIKHTVEKNKEIAYN